MKKLLATLAMIVMVLALALPARADDGDGIIYADADNPNPILIQATCHPAAMVWESTPPNISGRITVTCKTVSGANYRVNRINISFIGIFWSPINNFDTASQIGTAGSGSCSNCYTIQRVDIEPGFISHCYYYWAWSSGEAVDPGFIGGTWSFTRTTSPLYRCL